MLINIPKKLCYGFSHTFAGVVFAASCISTPVFAQQADYHVVEKQHLDGEVKFDYLIVDAANRNLFITHGNRVDVFNVDKKQIVGSIPDTHGVHGVALANELDRGFISSGKDNAVTIFELSTLKVLGTAPTGKKPDGIVYDPATQRVFAANGESGNLTPIDANTGKSLANIALGGKPEFVAVDDKGRLFVNLEDKNQLVVIDTKKLKLEHRYDLSASCDEPAGLSIDKVTQRLFVGCHNKKMVIVDGNTGKILDAVAIGAGSDATAYDAVTKLAFSSNSDGTLNIVREDGKKKYALQQTVPTMKGARTMAIDPATHQIYLLSGEAEFTKSGANEERPHWKVDTFTLISVGK